MKNQINYQDRKFYQKAPPSFILRAAICILILLIGVLGMATLASLKKPPAELAVEERPIRVEVISAKSRNYPVTINAFGEVKALTSVNLTSEVSGRVVRTHTRLDVGEVIPAGEVLFEVDDSNYHASLEEAKASVAQFKSTIIRLKKQKEVDNRRLSSAKRNLELAEIDFQRKRKLLLEKKVGTLAGVEAAEKAYNAAEDQVTQIASLVDLFPIQIKEANTNLETATARLRLAEINLSRCKVKAPFTGRLTSVNIERDWYVTPGTPALSIVDDSMLEIRVSIDSQDARKWLRFSENLYGESQSWFSRLESVKCRIRWTEMNSDFAWKGYLHRVVQFDPTTRTITLAIRVTAENAQSQGDNGLPLVEGMFCEVEIPGRTLNAVYKLPRWAVNFQEEVYLAQNNRLKTKSVKVVRSEGDTVYISNGLTSGDQVIITRLIDPLENALLDIAHNIPKEDQS